MRIVVKVGSNVLTRDDGKLNVTRMSAIVDQLAWLRSEGHEVVLVSSGAVTSGRGELKVGRKLGGVGQRQVFSAVGQVKLINLYYSLFREHQIPIGQVLTTKENFSSRRLYLNQRACMMVMLENGVLPIVNENDTVSITELMFTDNDELSGLVAAMLDADALVFLSCVDGLEDGATGSVVRRVGQDTDIDRYIRQERSDTGRGGMATKCRIARKVAEEGIRAIIANGKRDGILRDLMASPGETPHTEFVAAGPRSNVKKWIAHSGSFANGTVHVDQKAADALRGPGAASLLPVGVTRVDGDFDKGDIISIVGPDGERIALGRSSCPSEEARRDMGKHDMRPLVHYDYLHMEP